MSFRHKHIDFFSRCGIIILKATESGAIILSKEKYLEFLSNRKEYVLSIDSIAYVLANSNKTKIITHTGDVYETRRTLHEIEALLGDGFIKVRRNCSVALTAIASVTDRIHLKNGDSLKYTTRQKARILEELRVKLEAPELPAEVELKQYYAAFDHMPLAFADIEVLKMPNAKETHFAFCYKNQKYDEAEERCTYSEWVQACEEVASGVRDQALVELKSRRKALLFSTFKGHCGCVLLPTEE